MASLTSTNSLDTMYPGWVRCGVQSVYVEEPIMKQNIESAGIPALVLYPECIRQGDNTVGVRLSLGDMELFETEAKLAALVNEYGTRLQIRPQPNGDCALELSFVAFTRTKARATAQRMQFLLKRHLGITATMHKVRNNEEVLRLVKPIQY